MRSPSPAAAMAPSSSTPQESTLLNELATGHHTTQEQVVVHANSKDSFPNATPTDVAGLLHPFDPEAFEPNNRPAVWEPKLEKLELDSGLVAPKPLLVSREG